MRIMAIDYGDAHTGIAISDPTGLLAGFTTVINAYRPDRVTEQIALLAKEHSSTVPVFFITVFRSGQTTFFSSLFISRNH